jgi:CRP/FNR family transcriptional regulator, anaerobic regulatory protein
MLIADNGQFSGARPAANRAKTAAPAPERNRRMIAHGDSLFAPGTPRAAAYVVETGALCHYIVWPDGSHDVIECAFPGDIVGLGALSEHVSTAQAMIDTAVVPLTRAELDQALQTNAALAARLSSASDREFDYLRRRALQPGLRPAINRIAAYLVAVAGMACRSGETHLSAGNDGTASLAALLDMPASDVVAAFTTLRDRGLVTERDGAIVIADAAGLEALADA